MLVESSAALLHRAVLKGGNPSFDSVASYRSSIFSGIGRRFGGGGGLLGRAPCPPPSQSSPSQTGDNLDEAAALRDI